MSAPVEVAGSAVAAAVASAEPVLSPLAIATQPVSLQAYLMVAAVLFCLGLAACMARRNAIGILIGIELILNAANLNFLAFWKFNGAATAGAGAYDGPIFAVFVIILAACEAAVALGIVINLFYSHGTVEVDDIDRLRD